MRVNEFANELFRQQDMEAYAKLTEEEQQAFQKNILEEAQHYVYNQMSEEHSEA
jgi:hypothetical protein